MASLIPRRSSRLIQSTGFASSRPCLRTTYPLQHRHLSTQPNIEPSESEPPPEPFLASGPPPLQRTKSITRTIPAPKRSSAGPSSKFTSSSKAPTPSSLLLRPNSRSTSPTSSTAPTTPSTDPTEPYTITRTPSANLPIYHLKKRGGNLKITELKKIGGNKEVLREQLMGFLEPRPEYVEVRKVSGVFWIKGWYKQQLENFLVAKGF